MTRLALPIACLLALPGIACAADKPVFQLTDLRRITSLADPAISPDGRRIAVVVSVPDWKTDKDVKEIDLVDVATGARRALTFKRKGLSSPKWSPDGTRLAFVADGSVDDGGIGGQSQVYVLRMDGGDALRATAARRGVDAYAWSPDGTRIAYVTEDEPPNQKAIREHDDAFQVTDNHFLMRSAQAPWHLWVVSSEGGDATRLTQGGFSLQTDAQGAAPAPAWSRDGKSIAFTRFPGSYWGPSYHSSIATIDARGGEAKALVASEGANGIDYAPRGDALAFLRPRDGDQNNGAAVYVVAEGVERDVTKELARNVNLYAWLPRGDALLLQGEDGVHGGLWIQPLRGAARKLALGDVEAAADLSVAKTGAIAFIGYTPDHPAELYVMDSASGKPRCLTDFNAFIGTIALGRTEAVEWQGPDGFREDGVLTYPVGYEPGKKYPLVLDIHGGPARSSTLRFAALAQLLAAKGFLVFQPNYRGSRNLGDRYQHAIFRDTGEGPGKDVMAGLEAVEKLGIVDEQRIGVSGWSYGGYMTAWLTGHYPDRWRAAVAGAAMTDWVMDYTASYYQQGDTYFFGGSPWSAKDHDIWREQSPIVAARNVKAPTLILGDVGDPNVPLVNSYEWYHALRDAGTEVEFYAYPVDSHFPHDIVRTTDVYRRWVEWMVKHLKG